MSVNITLNNCIAMGPETVQTIGGTLGTNFHSCEYTGPPARLAKSDSDEPSGLLERQLTGLLQSAPVPNQHLGVILVYSYSNNPPDFYKATTRTIIYGDSLQKIISTFPQIQITLSFTLCFKNITSGVELIYIPVKHKLVHSSKVSYYKPGDINHMRIRTGNNYFVTEDDPSNKYIFNIYQARNSIKLFDFTLTLTLPKEIEKKSEDTTIVTPLKEVEVGKPSLYPAFNKDILSKGQHTDVIIMARDGTEFNCHKCFLTAQSDVFGDMLSTEAHQKFNTTRIEIDDMSKVGVGALLGFIYAFDIEPATKNADLALELLQAGHKYNIHELVNSIKQLILTWPLKMLEVDSKIEVSLGLFSFARNIKGLEQVKQRAFEVLGKQNKELMSCENYKDLFKTDISAAMELCASALEQLNS